MSNQWLRLWHEMPNDPKWRTISRASGQTISSVIAVYIHVLIIASNATERGRTQNICSEDLASALDLESEQIDAILFAMQGRVLDGDVVSGWTKRQVNREDGSAERAKQWREAKKEAAKTQSNAVERSRTQSNATDRSRTPDKDKDKDKEVNPLTPASPVGFAEFWETYPKKIGKGAAEKAFQKYKIGGKLLPNVLKAIERARGSEQWRKDGGQYIPNPATWLNQRRWEDDAGSGLFSDSTFAGCE